MVSHFQFLDPLPKTTSGVVAWAPEPEVDWLEELVVSSVNSNFFEENDFFLDEDVFLEEEDFSTLLEDFSEEAFGFCSLISRTCDQGQNREKGNTACD